MPEALKKLLESPLNLALLGAGLLVWVVWLRRRATKGPAELSQLPPWDVWWLEIIFFCFTALWAQIVVTMMLMGLVKVALPEVVEPADFATSPLSYAALTTGSPLGFLLAWWVFPRMFPRRPPPPATEHKTLGWIPAIGHAALLYLAWLPVGMVSLALSEAALPQSYAKPQETIKVFLEADVFLKTIIFIGAVIGAPIAEELLFRGRLYRMLKSRLSITNAAALGAFIFSLFHLYPLGVLSLFLFALLLTYAYERHGSIKVPILLHAMQNGLALGVMLLTPLPDPKPGTPETPAVSPAPSPADSR